MDLLGLDDSPADASKAAPQQQPSAPAIASPSGGDLLDLDLGFSLGVPAPAAAPPVQAQPGVLLDFDLRQLDGAQLAASAGVATGPGPQGCPSAEPSLPAAEADGLLDLGLGPVSISGASGGGSAPAPAAGGRATSAPVAAKTAEVQSQPQQPQPQKPPEPALEPGCKRFVTRCEGRWRVRSAPSLNSQVLGTIASGTVVIAKEVVTEGFEGGSGTTGLVSSTIAALGLAGAAVGSFSKHIKDKVTEEADIGSLWVQVVRLEAQSSGGVSEIKKDNSAGGLLYALRRNALGYGLYEDGKEPMDGPLLVLPDALSMELRADAQRAVDKSEDVSLTWKLLGAAESMKQLFGWADETGASEDTFEDTFGQRQRPEDLWEVKQRENLKKAAGTLARCSQSISSKAKQAGFELEEDATAGLPREVGRRFAKLRSALAAACLPAANATEDGATVPEIQAEAGAAVAHESGTAPAGALPEGSSQELARFAEQCLRVERTGGWPELGGDVRQEIVTFSQKQVAQLENCARNLAKNRGLASPTSPASPDSGRGGAASRREPHSDLLGGTGGAGGSPPPQAGGSPAAGGSPFSGLTLLPPPPAPTNSIGKLI